MTQSGVADRCAELTGVLWWEEMRSVKSVEVWEERNAQQEGRWRCHGGQIQPVPSITHIPSALALVCHFVSISLLVHKRFLRLKTIFKKYSVQVFRWLAYFTLFMCVYMCRVALQVVFVPLFTTAVDSKSVMKMRLKCRLSADLSTQGLKSIALTVFSKWKSALLSRDHLTALEMDKDRVFLPWEFLLSFYELHIPSQMCSGKV